MCQFFFGEYKNSLEFRIFFIDLNCVALLMRQKCDITRQICFLNAREKVHIAHCTFFIIGSLQKTMDKNWRP